MFEDQNMGDGRDAKGGKSTSTVQHSMSTVLYVMVYCFFAKHFLLFAPWGEKNNNKKTKNGITRRKHLLNTIEMEEEYVQSVVTGTLHGVSHHPTQ